MTISVRDFNFIASLMRFLMLEPVRDCTFQSDLVGILLGTEQMYV